MIPMRIKRLEENARLTKERIDERRYIINLAVAEAREKSSAAEAAAPSLSTQASRDPPSTGSSGATGLSPSNGRRRSVQRTGMAVAGQTQSQKSLICRLDDMQRQVTRNAEEIGYRRFIIDAAVTRKREQEGFESEAVPAQSSSGAMRNSRSTGSLLVSSASLTTSTAARPLLTQHRQSRTVQPQKYLDMLESAQGRERSSKLEFDETLSKEVAPPLLPPTRSLADRLNTFEERAMWNSHQMSRNRRHLDEVIALRNQAA
eukprot:TRINITY_DN49447_c0_g1_i1.p1 TRINITY_DN49447_c0_g1~~TRINITY_DN49447_c0_g1_i1.p1  ORF type:complete len:260 (-),score=42.32 TRINITY_DN49447_c0_g1_i1:64-843(-)